MLVIFSCRDTKLQYYINGVAGTVPACQICTVDVNYRQMKSQSDQSQVASGWMAHDETRVDVGAIREHYAGTYYLGITRRDKSGTFHPDDRGVYCSFVPFRLF